MNSVTRLSFSPPPKAGAWDFHHYQYLARHAQKRAVEQAQAARQRGWSEIAKDFETLARRFGRYA